MKYVYQWACYMMTLLFICAALVSLGGYTL